ncbi:MAG: Ig-like domain-containing protein [Verrucomicrobiota bacterium]
MFAALPAPRLTSPEPGSRLEQGPLVLTAEVDHASAWVREVEFLVDGVLAGVDATPPYQLELGELGDGVYEVAVRVRGEDDTRLPGASRTVVLARGLPVVRLTQPAAGLVFDGELSLELEATPAEGAQLERVELLVDGQPAAVGPGPRLTHRPSALTPGPHVLRARAVDRDGRAGWSPAVQVEVVPTPTVRWASQTPDGLVLVARTNLVGRLSTVYDDPRWRGYWALLPDIERGKPDALGGSDSIRLPSADLGAANGFESGLFYSARPRLTAGRYLVSLWARALEGELPLQYGLTDGFTAQATLGTNWSRLTRTFQYTPCGCYQDDRLFQLLESTPANSPWAVALAEVVRLDDAPLGLEVDGRGGTVTRVRARLEDGTELEAIPDQWAFRTPALPSGAYPVRLEVETASGLVHRPPATTLVLGPPNGPVATPRLTLPAPDTRIEEDPLVLEAGLESPSPWTRQVEFLVNGTLAGTASAPPYRLEVNGLAEGRYELVAAVRLADGSRVEGPAVRVQVARGLPVVHLRRPVAGPVFDRAFGAEIEALADSGRGISQVELLVDGESVFSSADGTGWIDLSTVPPGPHRVQARARDDRGRVGVSPVVSVEVVPTPALRWIGPTPEGVLALPRTNWAGLLMQVYDDPRWRGYWAMLEGIEIDVPDLRGGAGAIRLPTGDLGPAHLALGGLFYQGGTRLTAGRYFVGVEARAVAGELPVRFGLTDGFTTPARLGTNWTRLSATFQYQPCDCYQDERVFQVMESVPQNTPWELAQAEVYRLEEEPLRVEVDGRGGKISRVRARLADGTELEPLAGEPGFLATALPAGVHRVFLLAETASGLVYEGPAITLVIGPALGLSPGSNMYQQVRIQGVPGSRVRLESSEDLQNWSNGRVVILEGPELQVPWAMLGRRGAPALFLRAVLQPAAAP